MLARGRCAASVTDPLSVGSGFGTTERPTRELIGYGFEVLDPRMCLIASAERAPRLAFCFALWLWIAAGSDDLAWIAYYNGRGADFSDDGVHLNGAFGHRLRAAPPLDQLEAVLALLRADPASRRAVAHISSPFDALGGSRDRPCAIALQFFVRQGRLECVAYMRSQSAAMVLPYDAFGFMALQCWLAAQLSLEPGPYHHLAGSFHIYEDELDVAQRILVGPMEPRGLRPFGEDACDLQGLLSWEQQLRGAVMSGDIGLIRADATRSVDPRDFAGQFRCALLADAAERLDDRELASRLLDAVAPARPLLLDRFG